jgi:hypothetical protein
MDSTWKSTTRCLLPPMGRIPPGAAETPAPSARGAPGLTGTATDRPHAGIDRCERALPGTSDALRHERSTDARAIVSSAGSATEQTKND